MEIYSKLVHQYSLQLSWSVSSNDKEAVCRETRASTADSKIAYAYEGNNLNGYNKTIKKHNNNTSLDNYDHSKVHNNMFSQ